MPRIREAIVQAVGGWGFHVGFTEEQAFKTLNARAGDVIVLNKANEKIEIGFDGVVAHRMNAAPAYASVKDGLTTEDLDLKDLRAVLNRMIEARVWDVEHESDSLKDDD